MKAAKLRNVLLATVAMSLSACAQLSSGIRVPEQAHVGPVTDYVIANVTPWLSEPIVVNAVKASNVANAKLNSHEINKLDNSWMDRSNQALIDSKMNNELSKYLRQKKDAANGVIFEIFIFDSKGLNVGETDLTQDYNQSDEAKYWKSYGAGPDAVFVDKVGKDAGRSISQASLSIKDPATGQPIGAVTVGIDVDKLK